MAMTLRLDAALDARLADVAKQEQLSKQAIAVKAIDEYVSRRIARRQQALQRIVTEDAELLARLAE